MPVRTSYSTPQTRVDMKAPDAPSTTGGGGNGGGSITTTPKTPPAGPGPALVFPTWLKLLLAAGVAYALWPKKKGGSSLGSLLSPRQKAQRLREFHINEEAPEEDEYDDEEDAEYEEED